MRRWEWLRFYGFCPRLLRFGLRADGRKRRPSSSSELDELIPLLTDPFIMSRRFNDRGHTGGGGLLKKCVFGGLLLALGCWGPGLQPLRCSAC